MLESLVNVDDVGFVQMQKRHWPARKSNYDDFVETSRRRWLPRCLRLVSVSLAIVTESTRAESQEAKLSFFSPCVGSLV